MARKRAGSKLSFDPALFRPEPPVGTKSVKESFCGRERELEYCLAFLKTNLDVDGEQSKQADKRPWIIHGESRCGKSHLARRIRADLPEDDERLQIEVPAREQVSAVKVMSTVFRELVGRFRNRIGDQRRIKPVTSLEELHFLDDLIDRTERLLVEGQSATESVESGEEFTLEVGTEVSGFLAKLTGKMQDKTTARSARTVAIRPPDAFRLAEICRAMVEALIKRKMVRHILFLIDDVDLLEVYQTPTRNGKAEGSILAGALWELHGEPGADVLLTARSWYANTKKEFQELIDLTHWRLDAGDLVQIHHKRLKLYGKGAGGFLTPESLLAVAGEMDGSPGVFLNHLEAAYTEHRIIGQAELRDYAWFVGVFRRRFEAHKATCSPAATALLDAARNGQVVITGEVNVFYGTPFDNLFAYQSYWGETSYYTVPFTRSFLRLIESNLPTNLEVNS